MRTCVVLVDAGYLFAQGSAALAGSQTSRLQIQIDEGAVVAALRGFAEQRTEPAALLRIYWYDAPLRTGLTAQQATLASTDHIKLRLGVMNGLGQQKGVDSLIVSDLIELARNRAITDAVLLSGDEDVRISVQVAQSYGVRVHLLGVEPARASQSPLLRQEADTTAAWGADQLQTFMRVTAKLATPMVPSPAEAPDVRANAEASLSTTLAADADALPPFKIAELAAYWETHRGLPPEIDRPLLARCRAALGGDLTPEQRRFVRATFEARIRAHEDYPDGA